MKMVEADVIWTPGGDVRVARHLSGWERTPGDLWMPATALGEMAQVPTKGKPHMQLLAMFILFNTIVVRDRIPAIVAHRAFLAIDEYRHSISPDAPGAED